MRSNYHRSELEMYMPCTQWLSKPSHQMCRALMLISNASKQQALSSVPHDSYTTIRILHAESGLVWKDNIVPFMYSVLSFGVPESPSISMLHYQGSRNNWSPCWQSTLLQTSSYRTSRYWVRCKHAYFLTNGPWWNCMVLQGRPHNMSNFSGFSMTMSNPLILYSRDNGWILTKVTGDITEQ